MDYLNQYDASKCINKRKADFPCKFKGFRLLPYYSHSTITNQFCLEIILCHVYSSFDYLIYPYYPAYTG